ncbi:hypothetical protein DFH07DRAFT_854295 [Mycena maculata]|uniref:Uncharacterized protein n=1 Tax=Mycena maculata TaxID=230809 RepID=A0AAD7MN79_9AGAR|nr:hypothetical protein DFH07DRAFT_854295 [Mycena maculata]
MTAPSSPWYPPLRPSPLRQCLPEMAQISFPRSTDSASQIYGFVWKRPKRLSFYFFLVLRYVALLSNIGMLLMSFTDVAERCIAWEWTLTFVQNGLLVYTQHASIGQILRLILMVNVLPQKLEFSWDGPISVGTVRFLGIHWRSLSTMKREQI